MNFGVFLLLAILLSAAALYVVAYPIVPGPRGRRPAVTSAQEQLEELLAQREAAFQALRELNFDHQLGKITEEDFVVFEANLKQHAADVLRALDRWEAAADADLDDVLEQAVSARRAVLQGLQAEALRGDGASCPACGRQVAADDKFCPSCGAALPALQDAAVLACPRCGRPAEPGDRFCAGCGQALAQ